MRCKIHLSDYSSSVGVCASCLRERLFVVIEAQSHLKSISDNPNPKPNPNPNCNQFNSSNQRHQPQRQQPPPPQLIFPRSVSPYISRRKSDPTSIHTASTTNKATIQRFYSTPQVVPTYTTKKKSIAGKFGLFSKLFRSKSSVVSLSTNSEVGPAEFVWCSNRGMSPQNEWEELEERERERVEMTRPSPGRVKPSPARFANNVASFAFCLSPLVRASPGSRYHWGLEPTLAGETRVPATGKSNGGGCNKNNNSSIKPCLSEAASFCANRSRKLADFGRLNRNR